MLLNYNFINIIRNLVEFHSIDYLIKYSSHKYLLRTIFVAVAIASDYGRLSLFSSQGVWGKSESIIYVNLGGWYDLAKIIGL